MNYKDCAETILSSIGGESNIKRIYHCATRLRIEAVDIKKIDAKSIEKVSGIAGTNISGKQFQVIIGTDVANVYKEISKIANVSNESNHKEKESIISLIAGIFTPILPAIIGGGMIKALLALLSAFSLIDTSGQTYAIIALIGDAPFYFLPFLVAYTASQKFKTNLILSMSFAGVLLYPALSTLGGEAGSVAFFGIPVISATYSSSVIPVILTVWVQSYAEQVFDHIWKPVRSFLKPMLTLLLVAPIMLIAIGPLGTWCGDIMAAGLSWINDIAPWMPATLMGAFSPLIVMTGMHYSLMPLGFAQMTTIGYITIDLPGMLAANVAQGAAALCVGFKTKDKQLKELAFSSGFTAVLGITEPAMYGVNLKLKKPFYAVMIGGAAGGLYAGLSGLACFAPGSPGLATLPLFIGGVDPMGNLMNALITVAIAFVVAFVVTWILGFEDTQEQVASLKESLCLHSPLEGTVVELSTVNDSTFSSGLMGKGCAIQPTNNTVYSPCSGIITSLFPTKHAIGLTSDDGREILIHVGLNTVRLNGEGFELFVEQGEQVKLGQKLMTFDKETLEKNGFDTITPVIVLNTKEMESISLSCDSNVDNTKPLFTIY